MTAFNLKLWAKGLLAAFVGGASTAAVNALADPAAITHPRELAAMAGAGAVVGGVGYLKTHPPTDTPVVAVVTALGADAVAKRLTKPRKSAK